MGRRIAVLGGVVCVAASALIGGSPSRAAEVSNGSELAAALSSATAGDTITLAPGNYGDLDIDQQVFDSYVTITSSNRTDPAVFESIDIDASRHIRIDDVRVANPDNGSAGSRLVSIDGASDHIQVVNSEVHGRVDDDFQGWYGLHAGDATSVVFENNFVHDVKNGIVILGADDVRIVGNIIDRIGNDSMKFGGNSGVLIANNVGARNVFPAPGAHLDFIQFQAAADSVVITGNVALQGSDPGWQGIFFDDARYDDVLIENNLIYNKLVRAISISDGTNIVVRYNTTLTVPGQGHKAAVIIVPSGSLVEHNITSHVRSNSGTSGTNTALQWDEPEFALFYDNYYENGTAGVGVTIEDLAPVAGSPAETEGAYRRIFESLGEIPNLSSIDQAGDTTDLAPAERLSQHTAPEVGIGFQHSPYEAGLGSTRRLRRKFTAERNTIQTSSPPQMPAMPRLGTSTTAAAIGITATR